jgi:hypothetical protein
MSLSQVTGIQAPAVFEEDVERKRSSRWLVVPIAVSLVVLLLVTLLRSGTEHFVTALLAYTTCLLGGIAIACFHRQQTLASMIPLLFLPFYLMAGSVSVIYFVVASPDMAYDLLWGMDPLLSGGERYQAVILLFLVCYLAPVFLLIRKPKVSFPVVATGSAVRLAKTLLVFGTVFLTINAISKLFSLTFALAYPAAICYLYAHPFFFAVGASVMHLTWRVRIATVLILLGLAFFYTLGNARGEALLPILLFAFGLMFVANVPPKWKRRLLMVMVLVVPIYLVAANVTRVRLESVGWKDLGARFETLKQWREFLQAGPVLDRLFARVYFKGAHAIITKSPENVPYMDFSITRYVGELFTRILLPGPVYYQPYYSTPAVLRSYGILITESTSTEVSLPGGLWILGGVLPVIVGGVATGLFHSWLAHVLNKANARSPLKALFYLTMISSVALWAANLDPINHVKNGLYRLGMAVFLYHTVVKFLIGRQEGVLEPDGVPAHFSSP